MLDLMLKNNHDNEAIIHLTLGGYNRSLVFNKTELVLNSLMMHYLSHYKLNYRFYNMNRSYVPF